MDLVFEMSDRMIEAAWEGIQVLKMRPGWLMHYERVATGKKLPIDNDSRISWAAMAEENMGELMDLLRKVSEEAGLNDLPKALNRVEEEFCACDNKKLTDLYSGRWRALLESIEKLIPDSDNTTAALAAAQEDGAIADRERIDLAIGYAGIRDGLDILKTGVESILSRWGAADQAEPSPSAMPKGLPEVFKRKDIQKILMHVPNVKSDGELYKWEGEVWELALFVKTLSDKLNLKDARGYYRWKVFCDAFQMPNVDSVKSAANDLKNEGDPKKEAKKKEFTAIINLYK